MPPVPTLTRSVVPATPVAHEDVRGAVAVLAGRQQVGRRADEGDVSAVVGDRDVAIGDRRRLAAAERDVHALGDVRDGVVDEASWPPLVSTPGPSRFVAGLAKAT
jgi:hypothetical protein